MLQYGWAVWVAVLHQAPGPVEHGFERSHSRIGGKSDNRAPRNEDRPTQEEAKQSLPLRRCGRPFHRSHSSKPDSDIAANASGPHSSTGRVILSRLARDGSIGGSGTSVGQAHFRRIKSRRINPRRDHCDLTTFAAPRPAETQLPEPASSLQFELNFSALPSTIARVAALARSPARSKA